VLFQGLCNTYTIDCTSDGTCTITDLINERDGITVTKSVEGLAFKDGDADVATGACTRVISQQSMRCWSLLDEEVPAPFPVPVSRPTPAPGSRPTPTPVRPTPTPVRPMMFQKEEGKKRDGMTLVGSKVRTTSPFSTSFLQSLLK